MAEAYQKYDENFKKMVVRLVENGKRPAEIARIYGINAPNIRYWQQKYGTKKANPIKVDHKAS